MTGAAERLRDRLGAALGDPELSRLAAHLDAVIRFVVGGESLAVAFTDGEASWAGAKGGNIEAAATIVLRADEAAWARLLATPPPPTFHAFTALALANPAFAVEGDGLAVAQARAALERLVESVCAAPPAAAHPVERRIEAIAGRYVPLTIDGVVHDVFVESAGSGPPVLFLHTAGADSRQFQAQLSDVELGSRFRLVAADLPFHGRTLPPHGHDGSPYRLDKRTYAAWVAAIIEDVMGEPVVLAGCSMGAAIALVMAAERPDLLRGVIAIEPPFRATGRRNPYQMHVAVHDGLHNAAFVRGLMSPLSPLGHRRRAAWIYAQAAPGIYAGDLAFYSDEFDAATVVPRIDTGRVAVALLSGAYDYSATPQDGRRIADLLPGALFREMPDLGHFPMAEHPDAFRPHLLAALAHVASA